MTIQIDDKTFDNFASAVEHVKKTKPQIKDAEAYVSSIEQRVASINCPKTNLAKLKARIAIIRVSPATKRVKRVEKIMNYTFPDPLGEGKKISPDENKELDKYITEGKKVYPTSKAIKNKKQFAKLKQRLAENVVIKRKSNFDKITGKLIPHDITDGDGTQAMVTSPKKGNKVVSTGGNKQLERIKKLQLNAGRFDPPTPSPHYNSDNDEDDLAESNKIHYNDGEKDRIKKLDKYINNSPNKKGRRVNEQQYNKYVVDNEGTANREYTRNNKPINPSDYPQGKKITPQLKRQFAKLKQRLAVQGHFYGDDAKKVKHGDVLTVKKTGDRTHYFKDGVELFHDYYKDVKDGDSLTVHMDSVEGRDIAKLQKTALVRSPDKYKVDKELRHTRVDSNAPLVNKVPFGDEDRNTLRQFQDRQLRDSSYELKNKVYPPKPTQKDRRRIIKAKLQKNAGRFDPKSPNEYDDTPEQARARELITAVQNNRKLQKHMNSEDGRKANKLYVEKGEKINPKENLDKIKRRMAKLVDRIETIKQKNAGAKQKISEALINREHKHYIQFKQAKRIGEVGEFKGATQERYWKYWLLNAKQTNGNGWGVSNESIHANINKFIGRPFCVTAKQWFPESEYETYEHPYLPTNNLDTIFNHQAKYAAGDIVDIIREKDDYYAMIKPKAQFANQSPPAFCSPAIFQLDPHEPENKISKWEALHLAGLDRDPAYGAQIALLKGTCIGTAMECKVQFKGAKDVVDKITDIANKRNSLRRRIGKIQIAIDDVSEPFKFAPPDEPYVLHPKSKEIESYGLKTVGASPVIKGTHFLTTDGKLIGAGRQEHRSMAAQIMRGFPDKTMNDKVAEADGATFSRWGTDGRNMQYLLQQTGMARISADKTGINIDTSHPLTKNQHSIIKQHLDDNNIVPDNVFIDDYTNTQSIKKQLRLSKLQQKIAEYKLNSPEPVTINPQHGKIIADAYESMKHHPNHPAVKEAYGALIKETNNQFKELTNNGLKITKSNENIYKTSKDMHDDIEKNNHLYYFPTEAGFGQDKSNTDHPMLQSTEFKQEGNNLLANDVFRIVHDINGHHLGGKTSFGPKGEHQAYLQHSKMYSPLAKKALFTETAGQNNWVNFGPQGAHNRANPKETLYGQQKAGLLPDNIINGKHHQ